MKFKLYLFTGIYVLILIFSLSCNTVVEKSEEQFSSNSGVVVNKYNEQTVENLSLLCMIWGFAKYYHPTLVEEKYNWDFELFRIMPSILQAKSKADRNELLYKWIKKLPVVPESKDFITIPSDSIKMYPDIEWIEDKVELGNKLSSELIKIKYAERKYFRYSFCSWESNMLIGGINSHFFCNENTYPHLSMPDVGFRLLTLFRYWNIIQYYFPYKYLIEEDWKNIIPEFIPQIIEAKDKKEYHLVLLKLFSRIRDSHAFSNIDIEYDEYMKYGLPTRIEFVEDQAIITNIENVKYVKDESVLRQGDVILEINNILVDSIVNQLKPFIPASNNAAKLRNIAKILLRNEKERIWVKYERYGEVLSDSIKLYPVNYFKVKNPLSLKDPFEVLPGNIGYLNLGSNGNKDRYGYTKTSVPSNLSTKGLIIDLRVYPSNRVTGYESYNLLYPQTICVAKLTIGNALYPGLFVAFENNEKVGVDNPNYYRGKKIILVNEGTQSQGEYLAMIYRQAPNSVVIGSTTAGTNGAIAKIKLPGNIETNITLMGTYYPDGKETQRIGIIPDIEVRPTIKGIREGRDEVLEKAIQLIQE